MHSASHSPFIGALVEEIRSTVSTFALSRENTECFYFYLFELIHFHLGGGRKSNALGKKANTVKCQAKNLFYDTVLAQLERRDLTDSEKKSILATLAEIAASLVVIHYHDA